MNKALFLDRDGVINIEKGYVFKIAEFEFIDGVFESLRFFQEQGYLLIIITNQAGIGRGYYSKKEFHILNLWMLRCFEAENIKITKVYFCPTHPLYGIGNYKRGSFNRKPNPGMIIQAKKEFNIDLERSILVGDKEQDIETGLNAGVGLNILVKSGHKVDLEKTKADIVLDSIKDLIGLKLPDTPQYIY